MNKVDRHNALRQLLEVRCRGVKFEDDDIQKLVDERYETEVALGFATKDDLAEILPGQRGLVATLLNTFAKPAGKRKREIEGQPGTAEQRDFWVKLPEAKLETVDVSINQEADADLGAAEISVNELKATILTLRDNSTFMGDEGGMSRILIPKFYDDLWKIADKLITDRIEAVTDRTEAVRMLITGTPGTGKSVLGWYFTYKLRKKLGDFDLVYQHERSGRQTFYSKDDSVSEAPTNQDRFFDVLLRKDTVYVVDGVGAVVTKAMTFIFISPNPKAYKEIWKEPGTKLYYSKVWSKDDILVARKLVYKDIDENLVLKLYSKWGGVPRHVLEKAEDLNWQQGLDDRVERIPQAKMRDLLQSIGQTARPDGISDVILHYRVEKDYIHRTVVFASRHVSELVYAQLQKHLWVQTISFLRDVDPLSAGLRGELFEIFAHSCLGKEGVVRVRTLEESALPSSVNWPALQPRTFTRVENVKLEDVNGEAIGCYWRPKSKTNPTFDAVCTSIGKTLGTTAALLMTISERHGIKHDGLVKLLNAVPSVKRFYFVLPDTIFENFKKQLLTTTSTGPQGTTSTGMQRQSRLVSGVEQWAVELKLE